MATKSEGYYRILEAMMRLAAAERRTFEKGLLPRVVRRGALPPPPIGLRSR